MAVPTRDHTLQIIFGRAFLVELERGNVQAAAVFARAFLEHHEPRPTVAGLRPPEPPVDRGDGPTGHILY